MIGGVGINGNGSDFVDSADFTRLYRNCLFVCLSKQFSHLHPIINKEGKFATAINSEPLKIKKLVPLYVLHPLTFLFASLTKKITKSKAVKKKKSLLITKLKNHKRKA